MKIIGAVVLMIIVAALGLGSVAAAQYGYEFGPAWLCRMKNMNGDDQASIFLVMFAVSAVLGSILAFFGIAVNTKWTE